MSKCFIIMPISTPKSLLPEYRGDSNHFIHVLDHLFVPAIEKAGFKPIRPKVEGAEVIHAKIIKNIEQSEMVLCDMSALNPNVFFELGIRTAVDKPACMIVDDITRDVPFDTSIVNYHTYKSHLDPWELSDEIDSLSSHIHAAKEAGERNPLWHYFGLSARAQFSEKDTGIESKVDFMSMRLDGLTRQLADRGQPSRSGEEEEEKENIYRVYTALLQLAKNTGVNIASISAESELPEMRVYIKGELPEPVKAEMLRLAKKANYSLIIRKVPQKNK